MSLLGRKGRDDAAGRYRNYIEEAGFNEPLQAVGETAREAFFAENFLLLNLESNLCLRRFEKVPSHHNAGCKDSKKLLHYFQDRSQNTDNRSNKKG